MATSLLGSSGCSGTTPENKVAEQTSTLMSAATSSSGPPTAGPPTAGPQDQQTLHRLALNEWRGNARRSAPRQKGCFHATRATNKWIPMPCTAGPDVPLSVGGGGGTDYAGAMPSGSMDYASGEFPSIAGVTSESDGGVANKYSIQLNSNRFTTSACSDATDPICSGWQQFVYVTNGSSGSIFIQSWLVHHGNPCPDASWHVKDNSCWKNGDALSVGPIAITNLDTISLEGILDGLASYVVLFVGNDVYQASSTLLPDLAHRWTSANFNVFGAGGGSQATFNSGSTIAVRVSTIDGYGAWPNCVRSSLTAETNNLSLVDSSCCSIDQSVTYVEGNVPGTLPPFCLTKHLGSIFGY